MSESNIGAAATGYCERHPTEKVCLTCGGCGKRICTICLTLIGDGVRCPDCMAKLNAAYFSSLPQTEAWKVETPRPTSKAPKVEVGPNGQIREHDTGFRTYWKRTPPRYLVEPRYYLLAGGAALAAAVILGIVWGYLLNAGNVAGIGRRGVGLSGSRFVTLAANSYINSFHFVPEALVGIGVAEAVARITHERRGRGLQIIAGLGVVLTFFVVIGTLIAHIYLNTGGNFPPIGTLISATWNTLNLVFQDGAAIFIFWLVGIVLAVIRLKP